METRRRSARIKSQSDDEASVASSTASSTRATRSRARGTSATVDNEPITPQKTVVGKRTRSNSSASKTSVASTDTPTRMTRSRTKSDVDVPDVAASKIAIKKKIASRKEAKLDVIMEIVENGDDQEKERDVIKNSARKKTKTPKKSHPEKETNDAVIVEAFKPVGDVDVPQESKTSAAPKPAKELVKNVTKTIESKKEPPTRCSPKKAQTLKKKTPSKSLSKERTEPQPTPKLHEASSRKKKSKKSPDQQEQIPTNTVTPVKSKSQPIFDATMHRLRFLKLFPKSILTMVSSPSIAIGKKLSQSSQLVAISRQGGSVELVDPEERWITVGHVPGVRDREVDALVWVCGSTHHTNHNTHLASPRLIGASRDGTLFTLDFVSQRQTNVIGSGAGGVFCLASLCHKGTCCKNSVCDGYFAAGCEDGTIKLYRLKNGLELVATLPSTGNAVLSLTWLRGYDAAGDDVLAGSVIFAGVADGTIRRFDCVTSMAGTSISTGIVLSTSDGSGRGSSSSVVHRWKPTLRMVVENRGLREATKVWALQALSDGTVVSGDSLGNVQFWDGLFGTMLQSFSQSESGADVLCLAVSDDENKVFASGVDARVMCLQRQGLASGGTVNINSDDAPVRKWINVCAHRKHTHDVRALVICHKNTTGSKKNMELLVSGSIDTRLCTYVTNDFRSSRPRIWFNWSPLSPVSLSKEHRLIVVTRSDRVDIYYLTASDDPQGIEERDESKCLIKTISIKSPFNLNCSTISDDGKFLAVSDASRLYVFSLNQRKVGGNLELDPTKVYLSKECRRPSTALQFDATQRLICASADGAINVLQLSQSQDALSYNVSLEHTFKEHLSSAEPSAQNYAIVSLDISPDGKWLAMMRFSHKKGAVQAFSLAPFEHWWSLPEVEATSTCIKFLEEGSLAIGCSNNSFYIFNIVRRELSNWSHDMGLPIVKSLPKELTSRSEPIARILSTPLLHQKLILGAHGFFCVVDLDKPVPDHSNTYPLNSLRARRSMFHEEEHVLHLQTSKKRKHSSSDSSNKNFTTCLRYSNVLFQDFLNDREMVVVEEPWRSVLEELPAVLARRVYGT